jgi:hypothetical protein
MSDIKLKVLFIFSTLVFILILNSCATISEDDHQPVTFTSEPSDADILVNSIPRGKTPLTTLIKKKRGDTIIEVNKFGFETETFVLDKSFSGKTFGNIIFGGLGLVGMGVDVATGKAKKYENNVHIILRPLQQNN